MEKFSYLLCREGRTLYFAVLEQPEEWRGGGPGTHGGGKASRARYAQLGPLRSAKKRCTCGAPIEARTCGSTR